jgi:hypothetical protein
LSTTSHASGSREAAERARVTPTGALAHLRLQDTQSLRLERPAERPLSEQLAAPVEHQHRAADQRRECARERIEPSLGEHDPLEPLVRGDRPSQDGVLLVDELGERRLGDGDERNVVRDLEHGEVPLAGGLEQLGRNGGMGEPGAESQSRQLRIRQAPDELPLALGGVELQAGGQQQLAARQPRRRVEQLGDVDPANRQVEPRLAREHADIELAQQLTNSQHG